MAILVNHESSIFAAQTSQGDGLGGNGNTIVKQTLGAAKLYDAVQSEAVLVEVAILAVQLVVAGDIVVADEVHDSIVNFKPAVILVVGQIGAVLIEGIHSAINEVRTSQHNAILIVVCLHAVDFNPTVSDHNAIHIGLAVGMHAVEQLAAVCTCQLAFGIHLPVVAHCGISGTPLHNRCATGTIGSAGITSLGTGSIQILNGLRSVGMPVSGEDRFGHGGCYIDGATERALCAVSKGHITLANIGLDQDLRIGVCTDLVCGNSGSFCVIGPDTHRNAHKYGCSVIHITGFFNSDSGNIMILIQGISCLETFCHDHMIQLPAVRVVKLYIHSHGFNHGNIGNLNIHIIHRIILRGLVLVIVAIHSQGSSAFYGKGGAFLGGIALVISDLESHGMLAGSQSDIRRTHGVAGSSHTAESYAVHIDFGGSVVQTGSVACRIVCNTGIEGTNRRTTGIHGQVADHRRIAIIHCVAVVQGNIVNIQDALVRLFRLGIEANELRLSALCGRFVGILNRHIVVGSQVHVAVHPTVLGNVFLSTLGKRFTIAQKRQMRILTGIVSGGSAGIQFGLHSQIVTGRKLFRDVDPHTQTGCVHAICGIAQNFLTANVEEHIVGPLSERITVGVIQLHAQCVIAILNLTIFSSCQESIGIIGSGEVAAQGRCVQNWRVGVVLLCPCNGSILAKPFRDVAVLEIVQHLRALAEHDVQSNGTLIRMLIGCGHSHTGLGGVVSSLEVQAINGACLGIRQDPLEVFGSINHLKLTVHCLHIQHDTLAIGDNRAALCEVNFLGIHDVDSLGSDDLIVVDQLHSHIANLAVGGEHAVFNGTETFVRQSPHSLCRDLSLCAGEVTTNSLHFDFGTGHKIIVLGAQVSIIELAGCRRSGNKDNAVGVLTERTVTGGAVDSQLFAGTLRHEGRRTAAVTVCSIDTACCNHNLSAFIHGHAEGIRRLTSIIHHNDNRTVCLNTNHRAGSSAGAMVGLILIHTIFNDVAGRTGNDLIFPTVQILAVGNGSHFNLGDIAGSGLTVLIGILVDHDTGGEAYGVVKIYLTVNHHEAQGLIDAAGVLCICRRIVPAEAGIHRANNILAPFLFDECSVFGNGRNCVIGGVHIGIAADYPGIGVGDISLHQMDDLTSVTGLIVQNDFGFSNTGSNVPVLFADDVIIIIAAGCLVMCIIECRKRRHRHHAQNHNKTKCKCQKPFVSLTHCQTPFRIILYRRLFHLSKGIQ